VCKALQHREFLLTLTKKIGPKQTDAEEIERCNLPNHAQKMIASH
jgi:hypothetical protein